MGVNLLQFNVVTVWLLAVDPVYVYLHITIQAINNFCWFAARMRSVTPIKLSLDTTLSAGRDVRKTILCGNVCSLFTFCLSHVKSHRRSWGTLRRGKRSGQEAWTILAECKRQEKISISWLSELSCQLCKETSFDTSGGTVDGLLFLNCLTAASRCWPAGV